MDAINEKKRQKKSVQEDGLCEGLGRLIQNDPGFLSNIICGETKCGHHGKHCLYTPMCIYVNIALKCISSCSEDFNFQVKFRLLILFDSGGR